MRQNTWVPASVTADQHSYKDAIAAKPTDLFHRSKKILQLLGNAVNYLSVPDENIKLDQEFLRLVGFQCDFNFETISNLFKSWAGRNEISMDRDTMLKLYELFSKEADQNKGGDRKRFETFVLFEPFFFIPNRKSVAESKNSNELRPEEGHFWKLRDVCLKVLATMSFCVSLILISLLYYFRIHPLHYIASNLFHESIFTLSFGSYFSQDPLFNEVGRPLEPHYPTLNCEMYSRLGLKSQPSFIDYLRYLHDKTSLQKFPFEKTASKVVQVLEFHLRCLSH